MTTNAVLYKSTSIVLDWNTVSSANLYHVQVADAPDFSAALVSENAALSTSIHSFTDPATAVSKRWWRWRYSADSGATWNEWSEVGTYWIDGGIAADLALASNTWALINPEDTTDRYVFETFPDFKVIPDNTWMSRERNRLGELLSEYVTTKDSISLDFQDPRMIRREQRSALLRFHVEVKTFYLATYRYNGLDYVPNIWLVQFDDDPETSLVTAARGDLFNATLSFLEV